MIKVNYFFCGLRSVATMTKCSDHISTNTSVFFNRLSQTVILGMREFIKQVIIVFSAILFTAGGAFAQTVWNGTTNTNWYYNNPSASEFIINTAEELAGLAVLINGGNGLSGRTIKLGSNIALNNTANWQNWNENTTELWSWTPIGNNSNQFAGTFDGAGFVISGVYINSSSDYQGLFGYSTGTIRSIGVTASYIKGNAYIGGLAGRNGGTVNNSYATGNVAGNQYIGGLVGYNADIIGSFNINCFITNCFATGNVTGGSYAGGLVGYHSSGTVTNCYAAGSVTGSFNVGGLFGSRLNMVAGYNNSLLSGKYFKNIKNIVFLLLHRVTQIRHGVSPSSFILSLT